MGWWSYMSRAALGQPGFDGHGFTKPQQLSSMLGVPTRATMCDGMPQFSGHFLFALESPCHGASLLAPQTSPMSLDIPGAQEIDAVFNDIPSTAQLIGEVLEDHPFWIS